METVISETIRSDQCVKEINQHRDTDDETGDVLTAHSFSSPFAKLHIKAMVSDPTTSITRSTTSPLNSKSVRSRNATATQKSDHAL